jgi:hypothetical protein
MDILRNLFGSIASGLIRLLVGVGILAAAYFFIVKPVLHTTDHAIDSANRSFEKSFGANSLDDISKTFENVDKQVQVEIRRSFHTAKVDGSPKRLIRCIKRANGDVHRIQRCTVKF